MKVSLYNIIDLDLLNHIIFERQLIILILDYIYYLIYFTNTQLSYLIAPSFYMSLDLKGQLSVDSIFVSPSIVHKFVRYEKITANSSIKMFF